MNSTQMTSNGKVKILCLDDEARIVISLRSLFRFKYDVYTATTAADALEILNHHKISVVISDQRMPEMTGVEFLKIAKEVSPCTVRLLLTGFSDLDAIISSVNDSEIYRFLTKPWGNGQLMEIMAEAVAISLEMQEGSLLTHQASVVPNAALEPQEETVYILFKSNDVKDCDTISELLPKHFRVLHAVTTEETLSLLETYPIYVMIAALSHSHVESDLLKLLKRELPHLLTIGLVAYADYEQVIELINEARLYRYIIKPARPKQLCAFIKSAINEAQKIQANPVLLRQQNVMVLREIEAPIPSFLDRLKALFKRRK